MWRPSAVARRFVYMAVLIFPFRPGTTHAAPPRRSSPRSSWPQRCRELGHHVLRADGVIAIVGSALEARDRAMERSVVPTHLAHAIGSVVARICALCSSRRR